MEKRRVAKEESAEDSTQGVDEGEDEDILVDEDVLETEDAAEPAVSEEDLALRSKAASLIPDDDPEPDVEVFAAGSR